MSAVLSLLGSSRSTISGTTWTLCSFSVAVGLPFYFQVVFNTSASQSGVHNLPLIISVVITTIVSGSLISMMGHYISWLLIAGMMLTLGAGLIYTLDINFLAGHWIEYQIIVGIRFRAGIQLPIIVGQALSESGDITTLTALMLFAQTIGGALFVGGAEAAYVNTLIRTLQTNVPSVSPQSVIDIGATEIRSSFLADVVPGIIQAKMDSVHVIFALTIAGAGIGMLFAADAKWVNLKGKTPMASAV